FQIWIGTDASAGGNTIHYTYARLDNTTSGATVGAENATGTDGDSYFFNGVGTAPVVGTDLEVLVLAGGTATLGFDVEANCSVDTIINRASLSGATDQKAIAVTSCE
ncbi:MAG: hypothetical protein KJO31_12540, partial [Gammaproteobacteria bacterium]|nr:hypothetical protein [Gammaproteobacteria bacterium]